MVLVSRIVAKYLAPFNQFKDIIINDIPHMFSEEMAKKIWKGMKHIVLIFFDPCPFHNSLFSISVMMLQGEIGQWFS